MKLLKQLAIRERGPKREKTTAVLSLVCSRVVYGKPRVHLGIVICEDLITVCSHESQDHAIQEILVFEIVILFLWIERMPVKFTDSVPQQFREIVVLT